MTSGKSAVCAPTPRQYPSRRGPTQKEKLKLNGVGGAAGSAVTRQGGSRDERLQMQAGINNWYNNGKSDDRAKEEIATKATILVHGQ